MRKYLKDCTIYAVDFDGTLCEEAYPSIGRPNTALIEWLKKRKASGDKLILWTSRVGPYLLEAVDWCRDQGLIFDTVNENLPEIIALFALQQQGIRPSPKVTADVYIDDRACSAGLPFGKASCLLDIPCWESSCGCIEHKEKENLQNVFSEVTSDELAKLYPQVLFLNRTRLCPKDLDIYVKQVQAAHPGCSMELAHQIVKQMFTDRVQNCCFNQNNKERTG